MNRPLMLKTPPSMMTESALLPPTSKLPYRPVPPLTGSITRPIVPVTLNGLSSGSESSAVTPSSSVTVGPRWAMMIEKSPLSVSAPLNRSRLPLPVSAAYMPVQLSSLPGGFLLTVKVSKPVIDRKVSGTT